MLDSIYMKETFLIRLLSNTWLEFLSRSEKETRLLRLSIFICCSRMHWSRSLCDFLSSSNSVASFSRSSSYWKMENRTIKKNASNQRYIVMFDAQYKGPNLTEPKKKNTLPWAYHSAILRSLAPAPRHEIPKQDSTV